MICAKVIVAWAEVPGRVDKIEQYIDALQRQTEVQAKANDLMRQQMQQQSQQPYCERDRDEILWCWDERLGEWIKAEYPEKGGQ